MGPHEIVLWFVLFNETLCSVSVGAVCLSLSVLAQGTGSTKTLLGKELDLLKEWKGGLVAGYEGQGGVGVR